MRELVKIIIPGRPITKKNSMRMVSSHGRWFPVPSKQYKQYEEAARLHMPNIGTISVPINIRCVYYLNPVAKTGEIPKNAPDLTNLLEATDDILVKFRIIEDDNLNYIKTHDGSHAIFEKGQEQRTEITIEAYE